MPLASLVKPREAALFEELARAVADLSDAQQAQRDNEPLMESIRSAITETIKSEVKLQLAGSIKKGTYTRSSVLDIVVDTPGRYVSQAEKAAVVQS
jgi:DNA polymerase sigma